MTSGIRDNYLRGRAGECLAAAITDKAALSFVSAYFTIHAYGALRDALERAAHLRFLFGEPRFVRSLDPENKQSRQYHLTHDGLALGNQLAQRRLARECADWLRRKVDIRSVTRSGFLHGKLYHVQDGKVAYAMVGSSNFTVPGLGLLPQGNNVELNLVVADDRDRADLLEWFNALWADTALVEDVKDTVLKELARLYGNQTPQFIYYLTLFHLFRSFLDGTRDLEDDLRRVALPDTRIWQALYAFQKDGAKAAINKITTFNGCILADSVGLGKTYTALAVIKFFELRNERVLVLCPKKLRSNWRVYRSNSTLNPFADDRFRFDVLHHTDLSRDGGESNGIDLATLNWGAYDLVVIDESHNFRNNKQATQRPGDQQPRRSRYQRLMDDIIRAGVRTKVLLLSATPVNNELSDLRNQISIIAGADVARNATADAAFTGALGIASVRETTRKAQAEFTLWTKSPPAKRRTRDLIAALGGDFFKLLDGLSLARSRRHIATYYADEIDRLGGFPERVPPRAVHPQIDLQQRYLSFEQLNKEIDQLRLALYHPTSFLRNDLSAATRAGYQDKILGGFTQEGRERILIGMMKINLLKRLESSVDSFRLTIQRTIRKIDDLEQRILAFQQHARDHEDMDYAQLTFEQLEDPDSEVEAFTVGARPIHLAHLDLPDWLKAVRTDRTQLQFLLDKTQDVTVARDGKLAELRKLIADKTATPTATRDGRPNRKLLVFTAFADTARYLYDHLAPWARKELDIHCGLVCGDGENKASLGRTDYDDILTNFSPIAKRRAEQAAQFPNQTDQIDLLIATDCISEGQNLQDCDLLVNYDIHWNPVRIIQRFGRIDRIGSRNAAVHLVNFWPVADLDQYLGVKLRVEARMALVDIAATQTDNVLDTSQLEALVKEDLLFRDQQLKRLKDEILDLEDMDGAVSLTDFSLDEFRLDLLRFLESRREELDTAGEGLYAVVPPKATLPAAKPGALFCLRLRTAAPGSPPAEATQVNPMAPYFLVYVHDDGTVRFSFAQPKESLLLLRDLAAGEPAAYEQLCELFDARTHNGADMSHYDGLIQKVLASIMHIFQKRAAAALSASRGAALPKAGDAPSTNTAAFDLVTWLVILAP
jgi:SNF2 family DNA or RNA helicase